MKQDAFLPYSRVELSVTRHRDASELELWQEGEPVAKLRDQATLYGRADSIASAFTMEDLNVQSKPIPETPG